MKFVSSLLGISLVVVVNCAAAQADTEPTEAWRENQARRSVNPERQESYRLAPLAHRISVDMSAGAKRIRAYDPLIVTVCVTNRDTEPLTLDVRDDGLPHGTASVITAPDGTSVRDDQRLAAHHQSGPGSYEVVLKPGESTTGEFLIFLGGPPTGMAFPKAGVYTVRCACQPDGRFAPLLSNEVKVSVEGMRDADEAIFSDLRTSSISYFGVNEEQMIEEEGEFVREYEFGRELLKQIIRRIKPIPIDPEGDAYNRKQWKLVETLTDLLNRFPETAYSGYIARYLGLVHFGTVERVFSGVGKEKWDSEVIRTHPAYVKAVRYLTIAEDCELWPRTIAVEYLAMLHVGGHNWDKAEECVNILREEYSDVGGEAIADKVQSGMEHFRAKVEMRKARESANP